MDYEKAYAYALSRAKLAIKDCGHNDSRIRMIEDIFPELAEINDELMLRNFKSYLQGVIEDCTYDCINKADNKEDRRKLKMFKHILAWLEKQGKRNNIVEQLTAFAQHLNKRGAFRDDLCMDFEHEAQSFIEMQNNKEL